MYDEQIDDWLQKNHFMVMKWFKIYVGC